MAVGQVRGVAPSNRESDRACGDSVITADTVNRIVRFKGSGLPVVSLYARVPPAPQGRVVSLRSEVDSQLHNIRPMAEDRKLGRDAMMAIREGIDRMMYI